MRALAIVTAMIFCLIATAANIEDTFDAIDAAMRQSAAADDHHAYWEFDAAGPTVIFTLPLQAASLDNAATLFEQTFEWTDTDDRAALKKALYAAHAAPDKSLRSIRSDGVRTYHRLIQESVWHNGLLFKHKVRIPAERQFAATLAFTNPDYAAAFQTRYAAQIKATADARARREEQRDLDDLARQKALAERRDAIITSGALKKSVLEAETQKLDQAAANAKASADSARAQKATAAEAARAKAIAAAPMYTVKTKSGEAQLRAVQVVESPDVLTIKDETGKFHAVNRADILEIRAANGTILQPRE